MNPFDWTAGPFLGLYLLLLAEVIAAGLLIPRWLRPDGQTGAAIGPDDLAWLAGGRARFTDSVIARLLGRSALVLIGGRRFAPAAGAVGTSAVEHAALDLREPAAWGALEARLRPYAEPVAERLRAAGLLMTHTELATLRFWSTLPYTVLIAFGAIRHMIGEARDRPTGYLTILLILTLVFALLRWFSVDQRSRAGLALLEEHRTAASRLKRAPLPDELGVAVALFGTGVLAGSAFADFHRLRSGSDGGGSSASDTSDGSGCGGGGCGGCGG